MHTKNQKTFSIKLRQFSSSQLIIFGFMAVILLGSLLLTLPFASRHPEGISFSDALFTATSAVCVTGLVVHDTATCWTGFGQFIILLLIQIGGMGVITIAIAIAAVSGKKIGFSQRSLMQDAISAPHVGGIIKLTGFILKMTLIFELAGAIIMYPVFAGDFGPIKGIWYAIFHAISAFCNAGFDLMGVKAPFSSLTGYDTNPVINLTVMGLIIIGGIGFLTWEDIRSKKFRIQKYRMQSKIILTITVLLIVLPAIYFFFGEFSQMPVSSRIWNSLFQAVTPRTAGFNTADLTRFSDAGIAVTIVLMLIGGSPGSTAGGMKTTTLAVLLMTAFAVFRRRSSVNCFGRRIPDNAIRNAAAILMMYFALFFAGGLIISRIENLPLLTCLFETASAIGTVGLTLGITPQLCLTSRIILILLMFFGRVGGLTLIFAAVSETKNHGVKFPAEKITVG